MDRMRRPGALAIGALVAAIHARFAKARDVKARDVNARVVKACVVKARDFPAAAAITLFATALLATTPLASPGCASTPKTSASDHALAARPWSVRDESPIDPLEGTRGSLVALVFISTECPIANAMAPDLRELIRHAAERNVAFALVYPSTWQAREELAQHAREFGLDDATGAPHALVADPAHALVARAGATVVPEAALFRRDGRGGGELLYLGRVNDLYVGIGRRRPSVTSHDLRDAIDTALAGRSPSHPFPKAVGCFIESSR
jgi:hypothetical protein